MKVLAGILLALNAVLVVAEPFFFGQARPPLGPKSYMATLIGAATATALCGRILGWW